MRILVLLIVALALIHPARADDADDAFRNGLSALRALLTDLFLIDEAVASIAV